MQIKAIMSTEKDVLQNSLYSKDIMKKTIIQKILKGILSAMAERQATHPNTKKTTEK